MKFNGGKEKIYISVRGVKMLLEAVLYFAKAVFRIHHGRYW